MTFNEICTFKDEKLTISPKSITQNIYLLSKIINNMGGDLKVTNMFDEPKVIVCYHC